MTNLVILLLAMLSAADGHMVPAHQTSQWEANAAALVGAWQIDDLTIDEGDLATKFTEIHVTYEADGGGTFSAEIHVQSPPGTAFETGLSFRVSMRTRWRLEGSLLRETMDSAQVLPVANDPGAQALADALEQAFASRPSSTSEVIEITPDRVRTRDRQTGEVMTMRRASAPKLSALSAPTLSRRPPTSPRPVHL